MIQVFPFTGLGHFQNEWLNAHHHFSFGEWHDRTRMGFFPLRVWNDDTIGSKTGFPPHPHRDMEIITYIRTGAITHEDNMGNRGRTAAGDVQVMSAGSGVVHAEYNLEDEDTTLFQIWIQPHTKNVKPRWEQRAFPKQPGTLHPLASGRKEHEGGEALMIYQDAAVLGGVLLAGQTYELPLKGRQAYVVPTTGRIDVEGTELKARDGAHVADVPTLRITAFEDAEIVVADLPT